MSSKFHTPVSNFANDVFALPTVSAGGDLRAESEN